jgi:starch phosphorylase
MKALANGCLHLSVLDGWWDEGYHRDYGWAIGHGEVYQDLAAQDSIESRDLYNILEKELVPLFYQRGSDGIPRGWMAKMKAGFKNLMPAYNSHRMVQEYVSRYYLPCSRRYNALCTSSYAGSRDLARWRQKLMTGWQGVSVVEMSSVDGQERTVGGEVEVIAKVKLGTLSPEDVIVEAYFGRLSPDGNFVGRATVPLTVVNSSDGVFTYKGSIPCQETGRFGYTVRVMPSHERLENRFAMGLVTWA